MADYNSKYTGAQIDEAVALTNANKADIATNKADITKNTEDIARNTSNIATNTNNVNSILADFNEFNDFTKEYYDTYAIARFSGAVFLNVFNISRALASFVKATKINNLFEGAKQLNNGNKELDLPDFPNRIANAYTAFSFASDSNIEILKFGNFNSLGFAVFIGATSLKKILVNDGASAKFFGDCSFIFSGCGNLVEVGSFDMNEATNLPHAFDSCHSLKSIHLKNIRYSIDISASTQFEQSDLVEIISNLDPVSTPQTLTMGSTNLAKLTQEQILVATGKGWTLA